MSEENREIRTAKPEIRKEEALKDVAGGCIIHSSFESVEMFQLDNDAMYGMLRCPDCGKTCYMRLRNMDGSPTINSRWHEISPDEYYAVKKTLEMNARKPTVV